MQAYTPPPSLWRLVEQHVCLHEQEEVKGMLGLSLVEQSLDLHEEVDMLLDIWREMRDEEETIATSRRGLPEPPNIRDRLIQEIVFFVDNVKEKAKKKGIDPDHILRQHNTSVLEYAQDQSRPGSSVGHSSRSSDGRETPMMVMSPERLDSANNLSDGIEAMNNQLNYLDFDIVCNNLRKTLEDEVDKLLEDIQFLQNCLDSQADVRDCITPRPASREPTLTELREERTNLEKEMLSSDAIGPIPNVQKPLFYNTHRPGFHSTKTSPTRATTGVLPATPPSPRSSRPSSPAHKAKPLRANHNLAVVQTGLTQGHDLHLALGDTNDKTSGSDRSVHTINQRKTADSKPDSSPRATKSEGDVSLSSSQCKQETPSQKPPTSMPLPSPPSITRPHRVSSVRRRTASPGRVRVVDVTDIVDSRLAKNCLVTAASVQSTNVATASVPGLDEQLTSVVDTNAGLRPRPSSAHRFRKLVHGFRDGD